jgi:hypothetical protein
LILFQTNFPGYIRPTPLYPVLLGVGLLFSQAVGGIIFEEIRYFPCEVVGDGFFEVGEGRFGVDDFVLVVVPVSTRRANKILYIDFIYIPICFELCGFSGFVDFDNISISLGWFINFLEASTGSFVAIIAKVDELHRLFEVMGRMSLYYIYTRLYSCHRLKEVSWHLDTRDESMVFEYFFVCLYCLSRPCRVLYDDGSKSTHLHSIETKRDKWHTIFRVGKRRIEEEFIGSEIFVE